MTSEGSDLKLSAALDQILKSTGGKLAWRVRDDGVPILRVDVARRADAPPSFLLVDVGDLLGVE